MGNASGKIGLNLSDLQITAFSKNKFKKLIKYHISLAALKYLNNLAEGHSKSIHLKKKKVKCSEYLRDKRFNKSEVQILFQLRTRMFPVKTNFRNQNKTDLSCKLCAINISDQEHQLKCPVLQKFLPELSQTDVKYSDLFANVDKQLKLAKLYVKIAKTREIILEGLQK